MTRITRRAALAALALAGGWSALALLARRRSLQAAETIAGHPLTPPQEPLHVYHLGHSLVGRDMPAMLAQLAGPGHEHASQLGWGTSLKEHWEPGETINGFDAENDHPHFRPAAAALASGAYDAVVLTEMVEIADAVRYHDSATYLGLWAEAARAGQPTARVYLYETWHHLDDDRGWLGRIDSDLDTFWRGRVLYPAISNTGRPIYLIPAGQAMAAFARALEARTGVGGLATIEDLFALRADGTRDTIHFNDLGAYFVALVHYAVLYQRDPAGLPHALVRADGTPAEAPTKEAAALMQDVVWETVRNLPATGIAT